MRIVECRNNEKGPESKRNASSDEMLQIDVQESWMSFDAEVEFGNCRYWIAWINTAILLRRIDREMIFSKENLDRI